MISIAGFPRSGLHRICYNVYSMITRRPADLLEMKQLFSAGSKDVLLEHGIYKEHGMAFDIPAADLVVYCVRNPLDVVASFLTWGKKDFETVTKRCLYLDRKHNICWKQRYRGMRKVEPWKNHVLSYLNRDPQKTLIVKYEDFSEKQMVDVADFLGMNWSSDILEWNSIQNIKKQEIEFNLIRHIGNGKIGKYEEALTPGQIEVVMGECSELMERLGYKISNG